MENIYTEKIKELNNTNFKWWKVNVPYNAFNEEYKINWPKVKFKLNFDNKDKIQHYIDNIEIKYNINYNIYNLLTAINCEILEYLESGNEDELNDIFIFGSLLYKLLNLKYNFSKKINLNRINLRSITIGNMLRYLPLLLIFCSKNGNKILEKQQYNNIRKDHIN